MAAVRVHADPPALSAAARRKGFLSGLLRLSARSFESNVIGQPLKQLFKCSAGSLMRKPA